ncbi:hypothetical protein niasHT_034179 [Heterodera trifolii]|uniref:F-box domain-containing protein n=1 Tax=Heterodera trifolii TaxID=157864 RepID=A0ABD2IE62_9BILA
MSDNPKEAQEKMAKAIFISADCWLCVFDLLPPSQLGLGISMISHRFNFYVDEHFKTRKWTLKYIRIESKIGENGTKKMGIVKYYGKPMPIPQKALPKKVVGFKDITISYIDRNAIAFLRRFRQLFAAFPINLSIKTENDRILVFILRNIWPMIVKNIDVLHLSAAFFHRLRQFVPTILDDCPSLRFVAVIFSDFFPEFPCDDSAMASDGQAMAKWLFTPLQSNVPKVFKCSLDMDARILASKLEDFKAAFASASSPANFIVVFWFPLSSADSVVPFDLTNGFTREQLALKRTKYIDCPSSCFLLVRCPIARDANKWTKWEEEVFRLEFRDQWNRIDIQINNEDQIGDGLLDAILGPSDQKK